MPRRTKSLAAAELVEKSSEWLWTELSKGSNQGQQSWLNADATGNSVVAAVGTQAVRAFVLEDPKCLTEPGDETQKFQVEIGYTTDADRVFLDTMYESAVNEALGKSWFGKKKLSLDDIRDRIKHPFWAGTAGAEQGVVGSTRLKMVTETTRASGPVDIYVVTKDDNGEEAWRKGDVSDVRGGQPCVADVKWMGVNVTPLSASFMPRITKLMVWESDAPSELPCGIELRPAKRARTEEAPQVILRGDEDEQ